MTKWMHKCSLDWLKARQHCLTATDVKDLLPFTRTGRKRTITKENYIKVLSGKLVNLTEDDCVSTGAMARGHILEPYAIDRYNEEDFGSNTWLYHWDDVILTKKQHKPYGLAFSPDAMDYQPSMPLPPMVSIDGVKVIGEVKCYSPERHLVCGHTPKDELDERWQVATAMAVCTSIEEAYLLFYNPSMGDQLYIVDYDRLDLSDEIDAVLEVESKWLAWIDNWDKYELYYTVRGKKTEEEDIIRSLIKKEELNPEGCRSVMR